MMTLQFIAAFFLMPETRGVAAVSLWNE